MTSTIEPGRTAYEARFEGEIGITPFEMLPDYARTLWRRVEEAVLSGTGGLWFGMASAPKDGRKIDLLFPYPRGRQNDCLWGHNDLLGRKGWIWRTPTWSQGELQPEEEWRVGCILRAKPLGWRFPIPVPEAL